MKTSMNSWRVISTLREMQRKINWRHTFWIAGKKSLAGWNRITSWPYITQIDLSNFYNKNIKKDKIKIKKKMKKKGNMIGNKVDLFIKGFDLVLRITGFNLVWWTHYVHPMAPSIVYLC